MKLPLSFYIKKNRNWLGGIYANQGGSEKLSGNRVDVPFLEKNTYILLLLSESVLCGPLGLWMIGSDQRTLDVKDILWPQCTCLIGTEDRIVYIVGWIVAAKHISPHSTPEPVNMTLFTKMVFASLIEVRISR